MQVDLKYYTDSFTTNAGIINTLLSTADPAEITWKPAPAKWNLLEIICHLRDEEKDDFRTRLSTVLEDPDKHWTPINPQDWVKDRNYAAQDFKSVLADFLAERQKSITWLATLQDARWGNTHKHEKLGNMSASYILANWLAHDFLHMRQITKLKYDYLRHLSGEALAYAGDW